MLEWLFHLPVVWMALAIFAGTYLIAAAVYWGTTTLGFKGKVVEPALLSPLGVVFGLLVVFTASQVWGDLDRAGNAVASEASALRTVVLLADDLPKNEAAILRTLVRRHIERAVREEWPAMEQGRATLATPPAELSEALQKTLTFPAPDDAQKVVQKEIVSALNSALEARRERIVISHSNVNAVKWIGLLVTGLCVLIATALTHLDNRRNCAIALALFATGMAVSLLMIASHSRPFTGEISIDPDLLRQVAPIDTP
jgi:hypothetical protein